MSAPLEGRLTPVNGSADWLVDDQVVYSLYGGKPVITQGPLIPAQEAAA